MLYNIDNIEYIVISVDAADQYVAAIGTAIIITVYEENSQWHYVAKARVVQTARVI